MPCFRQGVIAIRPTRPADLPRIQQIESAAGELFRAIGMTDIADDPVPSIEALTRYQQAGLSWVAVDDNADDGGRAVGFILVKLVDGHAHIEQVTVDPSHARRRIGRDLVDHVAAWAGTRGHRALTLTTFRDVAWNGPYYKRLGFTELAQRGPELAQRGRGLVQRGPELEALMAEEAAHGLDPEQRIAMIRPIQLHG